MHTRFLRAGDGYRLVDEIVGQCRRVRAAEARAAALALRDLNFRRAALTEAVAAVIAAGGAAAGAGGGGAPLGALPSVAQIEATLAAAAARASVAAASDAALLRWLAVPIPALRFGGPLPMPAAAAAPSPHAPWLRAVVLSVLDRALATHVPRPARIEALRARAAQLAASSQSVEALGASALAATLAHEVTEGLVAEVLAEAAAAALASEHALVRCVRGALAGLLGTGLEMPGAGPDVRRALLLEAWGASERSAPGEGGMHTRMGGGGGRRGEAAAAAFVTRPAGRWDRDGIPGPAPPPPPKLGTPEGDAALHADAEAELRAGPVLEWGALPDAPAHAWLLHCAAAGSPVADDEGAYACYVQVAAAAAAAAVVATEADAVAAAQAAAAAAAPAPTAVGAAEAASAGAAPPARVSVVAAAARAEASYWAGRRGGAARLPMSGALSGDVTTIATSRCGRFLVGGDTHGGVAVWDLSPLHRGGGGRLIAAALPPGRPDGAVDVDHEPIVTLGWPGAAVDAFASVDDIGVVRVYSMAPREVVARWAAPDVAGGVGVGGGRGVGDSGGADGPAPLMAGSSARNPWSDGPGGLSIAGVLTARALLLAGGDLARGADGRAVQFHHAEAAGARGGGGGRSAGGTGGVAFGGGGVRGAPSARTREPWPACVGWWPSATPAGASHALVVGTLSGLAVQWAYADGTGAVPGHAPPPPRAAGARGLPPHGPRAGSAVLMHAHRFPIVYVGATPLVVVADGGGVDGGMQNRIGVAAGVVTVDAGGWVALWHDSPDTGSALGWRLPSRAGRIALSAPPPPLPGGPPSVLYPSHGVGADAALAMRDAARARGRLLSARLDEGGGGGVETWLLPPDVARVFHGTPSTVSLVQETHRSPPPAAAASGGALVAAARGATAAELVVAIETPPSGAGGAPRFTLMLVDLRRPVKLLPPRIVVCARGWAGGGAPCK